MRLKVVLFPGSFNPWHEGHEDVLNQALQVFDKVVLVRAVNPEKNASGDIELPVHILFNTSVEVIEFGGLLRDFILGAGYSAIIKGLRNAGDFEYERVQQYVNEDLGIDIPTFYVISDRNLVHKSSTVVRTLRKFDSK